MQQNLARVVRSVNISGAASTISSAGGQKGSLALSGDKGVEGGSDNSDALVKVSDMTICQVVGGWRLNTCIVVFFFRL
jgi:hypothetical protein